MSSVLDTRDPKDQGRLYDASTVLVKEVSAKQPVNQLEDQKDSWMESLNFKAGLSV